MGEGGLEDEDVETRGTAASMTPPARQGKITPAAPEPYRSFAMRPIGGLIARVTRAGYRRRSPAAAQLMMDWMEIMGPSLGALTLPQKLSAGTLTIGAQGPVAMELQHLSTQLIERLNAHLGAARDKPLIQRLRFVPMLPGTVGAASAPRRASRAAVPPPALPGIAPGELHEALARLGQAVAARHQLR